MQKLIVSTSLVILLLTSCGHDEILHKDNLTNARIEENKEKYTVSEAEAIAVAEAYYKKSESSKERIAPSRELQQIEKVEQNGNVLMYVLNYKDNAGFCLVSATKQVEPILAYATDGDFALRDMPEGVSTWFDLTKSMIDSTMRFAVKPEPHTTGFWARIIDEPGDDEPCDPQYTTFTTGQFIHTNVARWGQNWTASYFSPSDGGCNCSRKSAGCGPVAMAQVMRYYKYPEMNMSFNGYSAYTNYATMPLRSNPGDGTCVPDADYDRVALLIRTCGLWASTNYGVFGNCSSWTLPGNIDDAFEDLLYSDGGDWGSLSSKMTTLKNELKNYKPVIFLGATAAISSKSHLWVADGYKYTSYYYETQTYDESSNEIVTNCNYYESSMIAMNWGWNGSYNGWFYLGNSFTPSPSSSTYDTWLRVLTGIRP